MTDYGVYGDKPADGMVILGGGEEIARQHGGDWYVNDPVAINDVERKARATADRTNHVQMVHMHPMLRVTAKGNEKKIKCKGHGCHEVIPDASYPGGSQGRDM